MHLTAGTAATLVLNLIYRYYQRITSESSYFGFRWSWCGLGSESSSGRFVLWHTLPLADDLEQTAFYASSVLDAAEEVSYFRVDVSPLRLLLCTVHTVSECAT
eukprot:6214067-Pleurochrysis_carterae.AAC.1